MRVVDLVGAGVVEVFALEVDARPAGLLGQPLGEVEPRRPADVVAQDAVELGLKGGVVPGLVVRGRELLEGEHQRFGHVAAAVGAEPAAGVGERGTSVAVGMKELRAGQGCCADSCLEFNRAVTSPSSTRRRQFVAARPRAATVKMIG